MAKRVLSISRFRSSAAISNVWPNSPAARSGKSSGASVCSWKREWPDRSVRRSFSGSRFNLHLGPVGQLAHDVVQHVRRHGHGAGLGDVGRRLVRNLALEVGGLELQRPLRGLEQDVGQDGNGRAPLDHARHVAKGPQKLAAFDHQLHHFPRRLLPPVAAESPSARPSQSLCKIEKASDLPRRFASPSRVDRDARFARVAAANSGDRAASKRCRSGARAPLLPAASAPHETPWWTDWNAAGRRLLMDTGFHHASLATCSSGSAAASAPRSRP